MLNEKTFRAIYNEYLDSGLTIRDYCANQQMNEARFYYWQNKLKGQLPPKSGFVPVVFENGHQFLPGPPPEQERDGVLSNGVSSRQTLCCQISYPGGVCLKLNGQVDVELLRSLLLLTHR